MDSSTTQYCKQLEQWVGGPQRLADISGSRAYERFTGSQIAKIFNTRPEVYGQTERICLVSNFCASLFIGDYAPIDYSDGSGMNLLDITSHQWSQQCLDFCGPELSTKLGETLIPTASVVGPISQYFVDRYGFSADCRVVSFTGDNPASLIGMGLRKDDIAVSLGTSDTVFLRLNQPKPALDGHILCNPLDESSYMGLICFKNGSRTRERVRDECAEGDWPLFNELLESTPRGNFGNIGFYFDFKEIYPLISGDFRYNKFDAEVQRFSKEVEVRACIEGQFLRLRVHAENLGYNIGPNTRVLATGGASANGTIIQALADVFNAPVIVQTRPNSAALGGAFLAKYSLIKEQISFEDMIEEIDSTSIAANPSSDAFNVYTPLAQRYRKLEKEIDNKANNNSNHI
ncbi:unnamed protein product [Oppiella nova]|uniref:Xylulose kinase n=1 Tax=Oppiella nova TaxID=334625 RepID=A0A7R9LGQ9_9ACAR|nr:unnamed protein product [Oppiella nova]CAG2163458.1 unnamed protein product [Oppiella nova]